MRIKERLRDLLAEGDFERIAELAAEQRRVLAVLVALTFDKEPQIAWRAVEALGPAARRVAKDDPDFVREHLRRLHWLISEESGGVCWRAPESMAEIIRHNSDLFAEYIPIVVFLILHMAEEDVDQFKSGILWAIGRLGLLAAEHFDEVATAVIGALDDPDPQVRGTAAWCLGQLGRADILTDRIDLFFDSAPLTFYHESSLQRTCVRDLVRRALSAR